MNLLVIHETEYINKMIFEYQIIPEILATRGHNVVVIDYPSNWGKEKRVGLWSKPMRVENVSRAHKGNGITLIRPGYVRYPVISRLSAFFNYYSLIESVIREYKIDKILLYSVPTNGIQTIRLARKYHIPVIFRALDVLHEIIPSKLLRLPTLWAESYIYRHVEKISATTPKLVDYVARFGARREKCSYLPTGADSDLFFYKPKDPALMARWGFAPTDIVLLFAGTLYAFSGLDRIIREMPNHIKNNPNIKLLIVGSGEQSTELHRLVNTLGMTQRVVFTGFIEYPELPHYINLADICINPFERNAITTPIFPGKVVQYLACEKPVLSTRLIGMLDRFPDIGGSNNIYYYKDTEEFYNLIPQIRLDRFSNPTMSIKDITQLLETQLVNTIAQNDSIGIAKDRRSGVSS
ncbi:MAG TPA: glycosyltransferase [Anaerolineaceae bacterium]|nr:glycosyltransferase [Anaerolineaceae bacterium]